MPSYIAGFAIYTLAMIGIILLGYVVVNKSLQNPLYKRGKKAFLNLESSLMLEPRKAIYVIKAGSERFLVSSGSEGINFLTKLNQDNIPEETDISENTTNINSTISGLSPELILINNFLKKLFQKLTLKTQGVNKNG